MHSPGKVTVFVQWTQGVGFLPDRWAISSGTTQRWQMWEIFYSLDAVNPDISLNLFTSLSVFSVGILQKTKLFAPVLKVLSVALKSRRKAWKFNQIECRWKYRCFIYIYSKEYLCDYFVPDSTKTFAGGSAEIEANIFTFCLLLFKIPVDFLCNIHMTHKMSGPFTSAELLLHLHFHVHGQTLRFQSLLKWWALMLHWLSVMISGDITVFTGRRGLFFCLFLHLANIFFWSFFVHRGSWFFNKVINLVNFYVNAVFPGRCAWWCGNEDSKTRTWWKDLQRFNKIEVNVKGLGCCTKTGRGLRTADRISESWAQRQGQKNNPESYTYEMNMRSAEGCRARNKCT